MLWSMQSHSLVQTAADTTASGGITVASGATANTMGSWVQLLAASTRDAYGLQLIMRSAVAQSATNNDYLLDVGIGGSGSEQVILPYINAGGATVGRRYFFPIYIPAGSRIAVRSQRSVAGSLSINMQISLMSQPGSFVGGRAVDFGTVAAASNGTALTAPGSTNVKAAWTELTASTSAPIKWMMPMPSVPPDNNMGAVNGLIDVGVGAAGSEVTVIPDQLFSFTNGEDIIFAPGGFPVSIPAGSRLVARFQRGSAVTEVPHVSVMGLY